MTEPAGTFRRFLADNLPTVFLAELGYKMAMMWGLLHDSTMQRLLDAVRSPFNYGERQPAYDALRLIGREQSMPQYPAEGWAQYQERLQDPWSTWLVAGSPDCVAEQLQRAGAFTEPAIPRQSSMLLHLNADDAGATFLSGDYVTVPNGGTLGGDITSASGTGPAVTTINGRNAALTTTKGGFQFGNTSSLQLLHEPGTNATFVMRLRFDSAAPAVAGWIFNDRGGAGTSRGVVISQDTNGRIYLFVSDGTVDRVSISNPVATSAGQHTIVLRKTGLLFEIIQDGVVVASASAASLTSGASASVPQIGGRSSDLNPFTGAVLEVSVFSEALTNTELANLGAYYESRWTIPGGFAPLVFRTGLSEFSVFFPFGTHPILNAGQLWGAWTWGTGDWGPYGAPDGWLSSWIGLINHWKPATWVCAEIIFELSGWSWSTGHTWGEGGLVWGGTQARAGAKT